MSYGESPQFDEECVGKVFNFYGVCNGYFKLDDVVWEAQEDPDDGYRSMLDEVKKLDGVKDDRELDNLIFFGSPIAQVRVEEIDGYYQTEDVSYTWEECIRGYRLVDVVDEHVWLIVGTSDYNDYYPCYRFTYFPKEPK